MIPISYTVFAYIFEFIRPTQQGSRRALTAKTKDGTELEWNLLQTAQLGRHFVVDKVGFGFVQLQAPSSQLHLHHPTLFLGHCKKGSPKIVAFQKYSNSTRFF